MPPFLLESLLLDAESKGATAVPKSPHGKRSVSMPAPEANKFFGEWGDTHSLPWGDRADDGGNPWDLDTGRVRPVTPPMRGGVSRARLLGPIDVDRDMTNDRTASWEHIHGRDPPV